MRTPSEVPETPFDAVIDAAVERGLIDTLQRDRLLALAVELASSPNAIGPNATPPSDRGAIGHEARRGFNAITVACSLGALLVLFALAWFLADRWSALGPGGVFSVSLTYAAAFAGTAALLRRRGFAVAGGLVAVLAVAMTPVWSWAILRLTGEWPDPTAWDDALARYDPYIASRLIIVELATIGVALATLRRVRFFALAIPIAASFVALLLHLGRVLGDPRISWYVGPYYLCVIACVTFAVAYAVDRRQATDEDYALWFYVAAAVTLAVGYVGVWSSIGAWRHALPLVAVTLVIASLYLRRRVLLIAGGIAAFGYLGYLAFDVFRRLVAMPVALAALGLLVIVATVWMQRRFPALVDRVSREDGSSAKALPAGPIAVLGPTAIAVTAMVFAVGEAKDRTAEREWRDSLYRRRAKHQIEVQKRAATSRADSANAVGRPAPR
jgi:MFS family permease